MKTINKFLSITVLILIAYSCEPEELSENKTPNQTNISADTGDKGDEVEDRKEG